MLQEDGSRGFEIQSGSLLVTIYAEKVVEWEEIKGRCWSALQVETLGGDRKGTRL